MKISISKGDKTKISPHFTKDEYACPDRCSGQYIYKEINDWQEGFRKFIGKAIHNISGYRCAKHNKKVGGVSNSKHKVGMAIDFYVRFWSKNKLLSKIKEYGGYNYAYAISDKIGSCHVDLGPPKVVAKPIPQIIYTVKSGDTLGKIAKKYKTTVASIMAKNPIIKNKNIIQKGWLIKI